MWGVYWLWGPDYASMNELGATRPLPPVYTGAPTDMRCVEHAMAAVHDHGWTHHIQRLMVLGNLALLSGVRPSELVEWMTAGFVDGAEWVMLPNVVGMALHADGGMMATKPYATGGAYIDRMSDYCGGCRYDRTKRTGPDACPFTTLYWDFIGRHADRFERNPRMVQPVRGARRLGDLDEVRAHAAHRPRPTRRRRALTSTAPEASCSSTASTTPSGAGPAATGCRSRAGTASGDCSRRCEMLDRGGANPTSASARASVSAPSSGAGEPARLATSPPLPSKRRGHASTRCARWSQVHQASSLEHLRVVGRSSTRLIGADPSAIRGRPPSRVAGLVDEQVRARIGARRRSSSTARCEARRSRRGRATPHRSTT